jgi:VIT1/CCC1 family predicted Fe2+/Mn2+ transporter
MCWADRAGLGAAVVVAALATLGAYSNGFSGGSEAIKTIWQVTLLAGGIVWVPCRLLDFIFGGPWRRRRNPY